MATRTQVGAALGAIVGKAIADTPAGVVPGGLQDLPVPPPGQIRLRAVNSGSGGVVCELRELPQWSGFARHSAVQRDGLPSLARYDGRDPLSTTLELLLDEWQSGLSINGAIAVIEVLAGLGAEEDPPSFILEGTGIRHSYFAEPFRRWRVNGDPVFADQRTRGTDGHVCYAELSLPIIEWPEDADQVDGLAGVAAVYTVPKDGHPRSVKGIASKYKRQPKDIYKLNPKLPKDPDKALKPGTNVVVG